jgi:hypothetical protein
MEKMKIALNCHGPPRAVGFKSEGDFFNLPPSVREMPDVDFAAP